MHKLLKQISIALIVTMVMTLLPTRALAEQQDGNNVTPSIPTDTKKPESKIVDEVKEKREKFVKCFRLDDGSYEADVYKEAVHYYEDGQWKDIDNTLSNETDSSITPTEQDKLSSNKKAPIFIEDSIDKMEVLENKNNDVKIKVAKKSKSDKLVQIKKGKYEVKWNIDGVKNTKGSVVENKDKLSPVSSSSTTKSNEELAAEKENDEKKTLKKISSTVKFSSIFKNVELEYMLLGNSIKENIVINKPVKNNEFTYNLEAKNLIPVLQKDNTIIFYDTNDTNKAIFNFKAPFMVDAKDNFNSNIKVALKNSKSGYQILLTLDKDWINSPDRAFPVKVDPDIITDQSSYSIKDTFVCSNDTANKHDNLYNRVGNTAVVGTTRSYIQFALPKLTAGDMAIAAQLNLAVIREESSCTGKVNVHKVTQDFNPQSILWSTQPQYDSNISDYFKMSNLTSEGWASWNVTSMVKDWYNSGKNYGLMLEEESDTGHQAFMATDTTYETYRPCISLKYINSIGLESYWTYHSQDVGRAGTGYVNDYNGNFILTHDDLDMTGNRMPIKINHIYNTGDKDYDLGFGKGWRLNISQRFDHFKNPNGSTTYLYTDEDGTKHYYEYDPIYHAYKDQLGSNLKLGVDANDYYTLTDDKNNVLYFSNSGYLYRIKDSNNNTIDITYANNQITVTDGVGRKAILNMNGGILQSITDNSQRQTLFKYESGCLKEIDYPDGKVSKYIYDNNNLITQVVNYDGITLSLKYTVGIQSKVSNIAFSGLNSTKGQELKIKYNDNETIFENFNGICNKYHFNDCGNTVSIDDSLGNGKYYHYNSSDKNNINKLTLESKLQKINRNYVQNHDIENNSDGGVWIKHSWGSATGSYSYTKEAKYLGNQSLKINKIDGTGREFYCQCLPLKAGNTYTLSAYVKTDKVVGKDKGGAGIFVYCIDKSGKVTTFDSTYVTGTNDWDRQILTFTVPENVNPNYSVIALGLTEATGTAYFDSIQVEDGSIANTYNLIENSELDSVNGNVPTSWNQSPDCGIYDKGMTVDNRSVYEFYGDGYRSKNIYQTVNVSGNANESFVISGWAKAQSVPITKESKDNRRFSLYVAIQNTDNTWQYEEVPFIQNSNDWQYVSGAIVTQKQYKSLIVYALYYENANNAFFDNIQLCKDNFGVSYQYDSNGHVVSTQDLAKQNSKFDYDGNNNLITKTDPKGNKFKYTYDNSQNVNNHNIKTATTAENVVYSFSYDSSGNPKTAKVGDSSLFIESSAAYTNNGNYISSITDSSGNSVNYNYDETKGNLNSVEDSKGNTISYNYDAMDRLLSASSAADGKTISNNYSYENDRIKSITHNNFSYNFGYDALGNNTTVAVENQNLITNNYDLKSGSLLSSTYGNGQVVSDDYDSLDRIIGRKYALNSSQTPVTKFTYQYDATGNLGFMQDNENNVSYRYIYDCADRLVKIIDSNGNSELHNFDANNNVSSIDDIILGKDKNKYKYTTGYSYDKDNRPKTVTYTRNNINNTLTENYDSIGRIINKDLSIGASKYSVLYSYVKGLNYSETNKIATTKVESITNNGKAINYEYDKNGNIETIKSNDKKIKYYYNELNELIREDNGELNKTIVYAYDAGGNIITKKEYSLDTPTTPPTDPTVISSAAGKTYNYSYDSNWKDKLIGYTIKDEAGKETSVSIEYNLDTDGDNSTNSIGNPDKIGDWSLTWELGRQLASITNTAKDQFISYKYNDSGIRTQKVIKDSTGKLISTTDYHLVGDKVTYEDNGTDKIYYTYDSANDLVSMNLNGVEYYYIRNAQGDIIGLFDKDGTQVISYSYDSWGKLISIDGSLKDSVGVKNPYRYRGYRYDTETGLYYLNSRYYNPEWGRFINADALAGQTGELLSHNMFSYCKNNPVNMCDDDGYNPLLVSMAAGAAIGAVISGSINVWSQLTSHKKFSWGSLGVALLSGAASGALTGSGVGIFTSFAANAGISAGSYMATCGEDYDWRNLALSTGLGGISGLIGGKGAYQTIEPALSKANTALILRSCGTIKQSVCNKCVGKAVKVIGRTVAWNALKTFGTGFSSTLLYNRFCYKSRGGYGGSVCRQMAY